MMYGWSSWGLWMMGPVMMVAMVWLVLWLVGDLARSTAQAHPAASRGILEERFARGEINRDDYLERLATLERR